jgi:hypothetical protein
LEKRVSISRLEMINEVHLHTTTPGFAVNVSALYPEESVPALWLPQEM